MNIKIQPESYQNIFLMYESGLSQREIAVKFNVSTGCIESIFKKMDFKVREFSFYKDEQFFEKIDSEAKSYFLGLIYADGWVDKRGSFGIVLQEEDKYILEEFRSRIKYEGLLRNVGRKKEHHKDRYRLDIQSVKITKDLNSLGVIPNKSLILKFPTNKMVPHKFMKHFLRGYFDGDGCVTFKKYTNKNNEIKKMLACGITGSKDFCDGFCSFIKENLNINFKNRCDNRSPAHSATTGNRQALIFLDYIYSNCSKNFLLKRKYDKFKYFINEYRLSNLDHTHGSKIPVELVKKICFDEQYNLE